MDFTIFETILKKEQIRLGEPMNRHTTFGIGGPADCFLTPASREELARVLSAAREAEFPIFVMGGGANLLVRDKGIRGVVVSTSKLRRLWRDGETITAEAGAATAKVARLAGDAGLSGMEFAAGIPGTIGGAAFMNAGAYGGEMAKIVTAAETCDRKGIFHTHDCKEIGYAYRHSLFMEEPEIIVSVTLSLVPGNKEEIGRRMEDFNRRRHEKQPLEARSAGSTFKRPEGHFAGQMIDELGLKGFSVGDAAVSEKHAGFLINRGCATCGDMLALMEEIQGRVEAAYGVTLESEVQVIGEE